MIYMFTATEVIFLKQLIEDLSSTADESSYTSHEIDQAMELLNNVTPIDTERALSMFDDIDEDGLDTDFSSS